MFADPLGESSHGRGSVVAPSSYDDTGFREVFHYKRLERDVGEIAWAIPGVNDVHNTITIATRWRARGAAQSEPQATVGRKSA